MLDQKRYQFEVILHFLFKVDLAVGERTDLLVDRDDFLFV